MGSLINPWSPYKPEKGLRKKAQEGDFSNIFRLYEDEDYPDTEKATVEIEAVISEFASRLDEVVSKWENYGASDTASREAILEYIHSKLGLGQSI